MSDQQLYTVKAAVVKVSIGGAGHRVAQILRRGDVLPIGVEQEALDRLEERGLIEKITDPASMPDSPFGPNDPGLTPPAANAGLDKWLAFAADIDLEVPADVAEDKAKVRELVDAHLEAAGTK